MILTEWEDFRKLDWKQIAKIMIPPAWIFDSRSIVNAENIRKAKLNLWRVGDGS